MKKWHYDNPESKNGKLFKVLYKIHLEEISFLDKVNDFLKESDKEFRDKIQQILNDTEFTELCFSDLISEISFKIDNDKVLRDPSINGWKIDKKLEI